MAGERVGTGPWARRLLAAAVLGAGLAAGSAALAQQARAGGGGEAGGTDAEVAAPEISDLPRERGGPSIRSSLGRFGDPAGIDALLASRGVEFTATYIGEVLGVVSGGLRRGAVYDGRLDLQLDADLARLAGWSGAAVRTNGYILHGQGLSRAFLGNLFTASNIEALPSFRLFELSLEQSLWDGRLAIKGGKIAADTDFFTAAAAGVFVNSTFGWPAITAANLPSGGPVFPLTAPGLRARVAAAGDLTLMVGLFDGDPAPRARPTRNPDPQRRNPDGLEFSLNDPPFLIVEATQAYNAGADAPGPPGSVKFGAWSHFGRFADQRFDRDGLSLADPGSSGLGRTLRGNQGLYGVVEQTLYRVPGSADQGLSAFARLSASPDDRNLVAFYADAGLAWKGLFESRPNDTAGVGFAVAQLSGGVAALDRDRALLGDRPVPIRSREMLVEATYQAEIVPGWLVQPTVQYVWRPGAGAANPRDPSGRRIQDAAVVGLRTAIRY